MDMEKSFNKRSGIERCLEKETALCTVRCPFHLDVHEFLNKLERGSFTTAFRDFKNAVGFPRIALAICPESCKAACPRERHDEAVRLKDLERACLKYAKSIDPVDYNVPLKEMRIAIVGAGICGLACALRLCEKKYQVDIYEKAEVMGGHLRQIMEPELVLEDINRQFIHETYRVHYNTEITSIEELEQEKYAAVFVATGRGGNLFSLKPAESGFATDRQGVFVGGMVVGGESVEALASGLEAAKQIEAYVKTGIMAQPVKAWCTRIPEPSMELVKKQWAAELNKDGFTEKQAKEEAARCLRCACDGCKQHCDLLQFYKKSPLKMMEEVRATTEVRGVLSENMTVATKLIASCNQCGLCKEVCPEQIDFQKVLLEARRTLHRKGQLPWAFNDFFLRDMALANSEHQLFIGPKEDEKPGYLFFPGCQLGASDSRYVTETYKRLLAAFPDTALFSRCCGAPAVWAGDEDLQSETFDGFKTVWRRLGCPKVIYACPTCKRMFEEYLPEVQGVSLYAVLEKLGVSPERRICGETASVFDPCGSREDEETQSAVRKLCQRAGYDLSPLDNQGRMAKCCGLGGNGLIVSGEMAQETAVKRISQRENMYITYCVNCRDMFSAQGKETVHILDALFGLNDKTRKLPTITERRRNREETKRLLEKRFCGTELKKETGKPELFTLKINDQLKQTLSKRLIFEDEIKEVILSCEETKNKVKNVEKGTYLGYKKIGYTTYWAEYQLLGKEAHLINAYCHRMSIEG